MQEIDPQDLQALEAAAARSVDLSEPEAFFNDESVPLGFRALIALTCATWPKTRNCLQEFEPPGTPTDTLPRFPSTVEPIDRLYGGFMGTTALASEPGNGKTMLGFASACQTAATQERSVVYCGAELDMGEMQERRDRELAAHPANYDGIDFLTVLHVGKGQTTLELCHDIQEAIDAHLPLLIALDSINTIAELAGRDYFGTIREFGLWLMFARRLCPQGVSSLIISETNQKGGVKGKKLEFWSDLCIRMKRKGDDPLVNFDVLKARRGGKKEIGKLFQHWPSNRFYTKAQLEAWSDAADEQQGLHLVAADGEIL